MKATFPKSFLIFYLISFSLCFFSTSQAQTTSAIKILLVPGHDNEVWGAQYGNVKEANMNYAVARRIKTILEKDERFVVFITREGTNYTDEFLFYFTERREDISVFRKMAKSNIDQKIQEGAFVEKRTVSHNRVSEEVANILYGINKWSNENKIDAVIHIHFNDYPRKTKWTIGKYTGFAIYFPDSQFKNGEESSKLATEILAELDKKYNSSTYEPESAGLILSQKLIAMGANGTLEESVRSVLIEYGYVYEKMFRGYQSRHKAYDDMARLTVKGIENYFFGK